MGIFKWLFKRSEKPIAIKLGLALGSGGAKGYAELGAIKAFEENNIEFDIIAGTSIGSVLGAFYANGYDSEKLMETVKKIDFNEIKNFLMINMDTAGMFKIIDKNIGSLNIEQLKKPFMAVATNQKTGEEKDFKSGSVAKVLCASSAYPPFFKSVEIDGTEYIDGAFTNSVPADLVKQMGADYIVGIDLATHQTKQGFLSRLLPSYKGKVAEPWSKGYENSNIVLHPDLSEYKPVYFWLGEEMFEIGYKCALEHMDKIKSDINKLKYPRTTLKEAIKKEKARIKAEKIARKKEKKTKKAK